MQISRAGNKGYIRLYLFHFPKAPAQRREAVTIEIEMFFY
jgi:hypothetical protein